MSHGGAEKQYDVYWPRGPRQMQPRQFAPRLDTLDGKKVAQLWDFLFRGNQVFSVLEEGLRARFPNVQFIPWREFGNTHGSDEREFVVALPQRLRALGVDAAISAVGC